MRGKMMLLGGLAAGFVLGSRAGRQAYDELVRNAKKVQQHPTVQEAVGVVQNQANRLYEQGKGAVSDKLSNSRLGERLHIGDKGDQIGVKDDAIVGADGGKTTELPPTSL